MVLIDPTLQQQVELLARQAEWMERQLEWLTRQELRMLEELMELVYQDS